MLWIPIIALIAGLVIGAFIPFDFSFVNSTFLSVIALSSIDSILSACKANLSNEFNVLLFTNEFILNTILAIGLVYLGNIMDTSLFIAVAIMFTAKIFYSLSCINRSIFLKIN